MSDNPASDDARREAEERERWLYEAARVCKGVPLSTLQKLPAGAALELLESERLLKQYLSLVAHGEQVNGWTGEELEDARYRLSAAFRQWAQEQIDRTNVVLKTRHVDNFLVLCRFASAINALDETLMPQLLDWLGLKNTPEYAVLLKQWAGELMQRMKLIQQGEQGDE